MSGLAAFEARYTREGAGALLGRPGTLAVFDFGAETVLPDDPRGLRVPLQPLDGADVRECWTVATDIAAGRDGALRWSAGGGWLFVALEVDEAAHGDIEAATEFAYRTLRGFVAARAERHVLRAWNYLHAINQGNGDAERYRRFCVGRARGLTAFGIERYPAATAIGHHGAPGLLQVYALCARVAGEAIENPRQVSAWRYPRHYGPTPPSFARAMKLPSGGLAISGTAAVVGHASHHHDDTHAQIEETFANLDALLASAHLHAFDAHSPLKIYVRHSHDMATIEAALTRHLDPSVPRLLLGGDICRSELLVEIDGWRLAP